jgi:hypothetical protein
MHFYIGPVIVKFQNGQYGIRRWSWSHLSHQFLGMAEDEDYWWTNKDYIVTHCVGTELQVRARFATYLINEYKTEAGLELAPGYDKGTPVTTP